MYLKKNDSNAKYPLTIHKSFNGLHYILYSSSHTMIPPCSFKFIPTGISLFLQPGMYATIQAGADQYHSNYVEVEKSFLYKDSEINIKVHNHSFLDNVVFNVGDPLAEIIIMREPLFQT